MSYNIPPNNKPDHQDVNPNLLKNSGGFERYKSCLYAELIHEAKFQFVILNDRNLPAWRKWQKKWPRKEVVIDHVEKGGNFGLVPGSNQNLEFIAVDVDSGDYRNIEAVAKPVLKYKTRHGWHLWYFSHEAIGKKNGRIAYGCKFDIISRTGYVRQHDYGKALARLLQNLLDGKITVKDVQKCTLPDSILNAPTQKQFDREANPTPEKGTKEKGKAVRINPICLDGDLSEIRKGARNDSLFDQIRHHAMSLPRNENKEQFEAILNDYGHTMNKTFKLCEPLPKNEVRDIALSVTKWVLDNHVHMKIWTKEQQRYGALVKNTKEQLKNVDRNKAIRHDYQNRIEPKIIAKTYGLKVRMIKLIVGKYRAGKSRKRLPNASPEKTNSLNARMHC